MLCIFLFDIITVLLGNAYEKRYRITDEPFIRGLADRIHFLNTDNSDCILLESQGHFALIDSGWGSDNPNAKHHRPGYEQRVLDYLKRVAGDADGNVFLDFVLPTHYHYDHAGGFARILANPAMHAGTVYLRPLDEQSMFEYELQTWHIFPLACNATQAGDRHQRDRSGLPRCALEAYTDQPHADFLHRARKRSHRHFERRWQHQFDKESAFILTAKHSRAIIRLVMNNREVRN